MRNQLGPVHHYAFTPPLWRKDCHFATESIEIKDACVFVDERVHTQWHGAAMRKRDSLPFICSPLSPLPSICVQRCLMLRIRMVTHKPGFRLLWGLG